MIAYFIDGPMAGKSEKVKNPPPKSLLFPIPTSPPHLINVAAEPGPFKAVTYNLVEFSGPEGYAYYKQKLDSPPVSLAKVDAVTDALMKAYSTDLNTSTATPKLKPYKTWDEVKAEKGYPTINTYPTEETETPVEVPPALLVIPTVINKDKKPPAEMELVEVRSPVKIGEAKFNKGGSVKPIKQIVLVTGNSNTVRVMNPTVISHKFWVTVYYSDTHNKSYGYWKTNTSIKWEHAGG